jgi:hypothetical protein
MSNLGRRRRNFISRIFHLLPSVPRADVEAVLTARTAREYVQARDRIVGRLHWAAFAYPRKDAPRGISAHDLRGPRLLETVSRTFDGDREGAP